MENQEYIIINKTAIQKRIEELENYTYATQNIYLEGKNEGELQALSNLLSQSTPLIPEIEKAFDVGLQAIQENNGKLKVKMPKAKQDYISNLKLDI